MTRRRNRLLILVLAALSLLCSGPGAWAQQAPPTGFTPPTAVVAQTPTGAWQFLYVDSSGNLRTTGTGSPSAGQSPPTGFVPAYALVAQTPSGTWAFLRVDASGNLVTTGGGGGATTLDELTDVVITTPTLNDGFFYNGSNWVNTVVGLPSRAGNGGTVVLATTDRNSVVNVGHATANAVSIAQAGVTAGNGFIGGWQTIVCTTGAGLTTITPATSTINGKATLTLVTDACARIFVPTEADTNYRAVVSVLPLATAPIALDAATGAIGVASGSTIPTTTALTSLKVWTCEVVVGDPGAASSVLADDNDTPDVCANDTAVTITITAVHCYANTGSPTVTPIVNGGSATSILSGAGTCTQTAGGASLSLQGTPTLTAGQLVDMNITTAGGAAKYIVVRISGTKP
jgi:hypothetical protein